MKKKVYLIFILPSLLVFLFAIVIPFFMGINIMFTNWDGISRTYEYVGLKNFMLFFTDKSVIKPIITTLAYGFGYTLLNNLFALSMKVV